MKLEKITKSATRRYPDACGTAHALDLIGERWALLVMRELMLGPCRFGDLRDSLAGISANVLTQRLEGLEASGIVRRRKLPPPASVQVYELTEWGLEAEPIILHLGRWGARSPLQDPTMPLSAVSMMLSFRAMFDAERAEGVDVTVAFRVDGQDYVGRVRGGRFSAERGTAKTADVSVSGSPIAILGIVYGFAPAEAVKITGDPAAWQRFSDIFELPQKAELPGDSTAR